MIAMALLNLGTLLPGMIPIYLPPYSPDLNPIEYSFGLIKQELRSEGVFDTSTKDIAYLYDLMMRTITPSRAFGWIRHCCYDVEDDPTYDWHRFGAD